MKKLLPTLLLTFTVTYSIIAQPSIQWQKCLGGTGVNIANTIQQTTDGGYIVAGNCEFNDGDVTGNHGSGDFWVVKLNSTGTIVWQKSLGGTGNDWAGSIQQTTDGGYIVAGSSSSNDDDVTGNHGSGDFWVVKLNSTGTIVWQKSLGGTDMDQPYEIQQTTDGGYIVAGIANSNDSDVTGNHGSGDFWVVKLSSLGSIQWEESFGGTGNDNAWAIQQTTDGGYIVSGSTLSNDGDVTGNHGSADCWVVKLDSTGTIVWQKSLGGTGNDNAWAIQQTTDGGYIIAGNCEFNDGDVTGNHGSIDCWVVKLDSTGTIVWQKSLGGTDLDVAYSIQQTYDGGYIIAGYTKSNDSDVTGNHSTNSDYWIVKLYSTGSIQWQKCLGGTDQDVAYSIQQTTDGGYIVSGGTLSNDGDVTGNHGSADFWVVKLDDATAIDEITNPISNLQITPNPVSQTTNISFSLSQSENLSVSVYDITGRLVTNLFIGKMNAGSHEIKWDVSAENNIEEGVYYLNIVGAGFSNSSKIVVLK